jgi:hypothetical protein
MDKIIGLRALIELFEKLRKVNGHSTITAKDAATLLRSRMNKVVSPVEIICKYVRILCIVLKRLHDNHADNLKCDKWGCKYLNRCGFLTINELCSFGVRSGCKYYKKWSFENMEADRKDLTREATRHLGPSMTAIHLTKTNAEFAKLGFVPPNCKLDGPLQTDDRGKKLEEYNVLNSCSFTKFTNRIFCKTHVKSEYRNEMRTTLEYQEDHLWAFKLAREAYTDNDDNPWMHSLEFLSYVALCAFVPDSSISHMSPADGYREVCMHFENGTIAEMFGQVSQPSNGFWELEQSEDPVPMTAADLTAEQIAEALDAILQPAKRAKQAEDGDCENESDVNFRSLVANIANKRKQSAK